MVPKRRQPKKEKAPSPLDEKARALEEEFAKVQAEIERRKRVIEEAPERAKEIERRRREELINRASRTDGRRGSHVALPDRRFGHELNATMSARPRSLRAERNQGRLIFFVLLFVFVGVLYAAYRTFVVQ